MRPRGARSRLHVVSTTAVHIFALSLRAPKCWNITPWREGELWTRRKVVAGG